MKTTFPNFLTIFLVVYSFQPLFAQAGELDQSFGDNGIYLHENYWSHEFEIQPDGKFILGGTKSVFGQFNTDLIVGRLNENGSIDSTFGMNGKTSINFDDLSTLINSWEKFSSSTTLSDGRIVVSGVKSSGLVNYTGEAIIAMLQPNGLLDSTFGSSGRRLFNFSGFDVGLTNVSRFSNGDFLFSATLRLYDSIFYSHIALLRFKPNGQLDTGFGTNGDGILLTSVGSNTSYYFSKPFFKVTPDDKIVVVGTSDSYTICTNRFNTDGSADLGFGNNGQIFTTIGFGTKVAGISIQKDHKILIYGQSRIAGEPVFAIVRLNVDGSNDMTWAQDGILLDDVGEYDNAINAGALQNDGKVVVVGTRINIDGITQWVVARYHSDGTKDSSFGQDGLQCTDFQNTSFETPNGVAISLNHAIYVSGNASTSGQNYWVLAKYFPGDYVSTQKPAQVEKLKASVSPNPTTPGQSLLFRFELQHPGVVSAQLINSKGEVVQNCFVSESHPEGENIHEIGLKSTLPVGQYWVLIKTTECQTSLPILLKR